MLVITVTGLAAMFRIDRVLSEPSVKLKLKLDVILVEIGFPTFNIVILNDCRGFIPVTPVGIVS